MPKPKVKEGWSLFLRLISCAFSDSKAGILGNSSLELSLSRPIELSEPQHGLTIEQ